MLCKYTQMVGNALKLRYFVLFKDNFTRYRFVYFVRNKSEIHTKLLFMLSEAKANGIAVKELLSDNGGEFDNETVSEQRRSDLCR